ncbi:MAG TPA: sigma-70 family RNA polymerase sigma factor [Armatimonadota bacterium]|nr:sigma-70 family RNA polymerase sigma factor [Armatimonadota bacterium]
MQETAQISPQSAALFESLVRSHEPALRRLARRLTHSLEDAEDLLQESLVDAYRGFNGFRAGSHFYSWFARILSNNAIDMARRRRLPQVSLDETEQDDRPAFELPDHRTNPERLLLDRHFDQRLQTALDALPPAQLATVLLCDLEGTTYEEAAEAEGCPIGTIRSRLHRAHAALQRGLQSAPAPEVPAPRHSRRTFLRMAQATLAGAALAGLAASAPAAAGMEGRSVSGSEEGARLRLLVGSGDPRWSRALTGALSAGPFDVTCADLAAVTPEHLRAADLLVWHSGTTEASLPGAKLQEVLRQVRERCLGVLILRGAGDERLLAGLLGPECRIRPAGDNAHGPLRLRVTAPRHPVTAGLGAFYIPGGLLPRQADTLPRPEMVLLDSPSTEAPGWQAVTWTAGGSRVFYWAPGLVGDTHALPAEVAHLLRSAARWAAQPSTRA